MQKVWTGQWQKYLEDVLRLQSGSSILRHLLDFHCDSLRRIVEKWKGKAVRSNDDVDHCHTWGVLLCSKWSEMVQ